MIFVHPLFIVSNVEFSAVGAFVVVHTIHTVNQAAFFIYSVVCAT